MQLIVGTNKGRLVMFDLRLLDRGQLLAYMQSLNGTLHFLPSLPFLFLPLPCLSPVPLPSLLVEVVGLVSLNPARGSGSAVALGAGSEAELQPKLN